jgi:ATP-dependent helicase/nuclease subunit A
MEAARNMALGEARNEYRRLLYVAMTRAIERPIVCGVDGQRKRPEGCWYDLTRNALEMHCVSEPADDGGGEVLRFRKVAEAPPTKPSKAQTLELALLPPWLTQKITEAAASAPIRPSGFADDGEVAGLLGPRDARRRAILRGNILHRLMQSLPDVPPARRAEAARRHVARHNIDFSEAAREAIAASALALLDDARFNALFLLGSRAEVPIVGRVNGQIVNGVVDRLVVTKDAVLIVDYKTNRPAPRSLAEATTRHADYVRQLALYRAVLMRLYPGRRVRAAGARRAAVDRYAGADGDSGQRPRRCPRYPHLPVSILDAAPGRP